MKNNYKTSWNRAFTLIELMIVIVILGILMATILPRVTGGQARARDTGRIADLSNIEQALALYNVDYGSFPTISGNCLVPSSTEGLAVDNKAALEKLESYLKGNKIPQPGKNDTFDDAGTACKGSYYYSILPWRGNANGAYVLGTQIDTFQMLNSTETEIAGLVDGTYASDSVLQAAVGAIALDPTGEILEADMPEPINYGYYKFGTQ